MDNPPPAVRHIPMTRLEKGKYRFNISSGNFELSSYWIRRMLAANPQDILQIETRPGKLTIKVIPQPLVEPESAPFKIEVRA